MASQSKERAEEGGLGGGGPGGFEKVTRGMGKLGAPSMNLRSAPSSLMPSPSLILRDRSITCSLKFGLFKIPARSLV